MTTNKLKLCVFCDNQLTKENRSKEHIIPQWLLDFLGIREETIQPTHFSSKGHTNSTRHHTLDNLLAGQICEECNNGWMSSLEQDAIPILKPLIAGDRVIVDLDDTERQIIGRWTSKTALTLNSASNYLKNIPSDHYKYTMTTAGSLPSGVFSFAQQHHGTRPFYWIQSPTWILNGNSDSLQILGESLKDKSYKVAFQFGKLMLLIGYIPLDNIFPVLCRGIHIPLIPKTGKCGWYDTKEFPWHDSEKALMEFHFGLQATLME
jgi:hypothetical protein